MIQSKWINRVSNYFPLWVAHDDARVEPFRQNAAPPRRVTLPPPAYGALIARTPAVTREPPASRPCSSGHRTSTCAAGRRAPHPDYRRTSHEFPKVSDTAACGQQVERQTWTTKTVSEGGMVNTVGVHTHISIRTATGKKFAPDSDFPLARWQMFVSEKKNFMRGEGKDTDPDLLSVIPCA